MPSTLLQQGYLEADVLQSLPPKTFWYVFPKGNRVWMHISVLALVSLAPQMTPLCSVLEFILRGRVYSKRQGLMSLMVPSVK